MPCGKPNSRFDNLLKDLLFLVLVLVLLLLFLSCCGCTPKVESGKTNPKELVYEAEQFCEGEEKQLAPRLWCVDFKNGVVKYYCKINSCEFKVWYVITYKNNKDVEYVVLELPNIPISSINTF